MVSKAPSSISVSMTPLEQAAVSASAALEKARPPSAAARTRARALVMRCGGGPARRTPTRAGSGPAFNGVPIAIRNTMPRGLKVQRATQSMNFRQLPESGGIARREAMDFRFARPVAPDRTSQTTPCVIFVPSGTSTKSPGATDMPLGTA